MRPGCELRAFNAEVTDSFTIALSPCSHNCPPTLVPSFRNDGEGCCGWCIALSFHDTSSLRTWRSSAISPISFGHSLVILGRFPPLTLVSHPDLSSSARPLSHSFWRSVSSCGPHCAVQRSHPHQRGQSVSCVYLIRRWWLLQGLSLHHPPTASP